MFSISAVRQFRPAIHVQGDSVLGSESLEESILCSRILGSDAGRRIGCIFEGAQYTLSTIVLNTVHRLQHIEPSDFDISVFELPPDCANVAFRTLVGLFRSLYSYRAGPLPRRRRLRVTATSTLSSREMAVSAQCHPLCTIVPCAIDRVFKMCSIRARVWPHRTNTAASKMNPIVRHMFALFAFGALILRTLL